MKKKNQKKIKNLVSKEKKPNWFALPEEAKKWIGAIIVFLLALILILSFFESAGVAGKFLVKGLTFLFGKVVFILPLILFFSGLVFILTKYQKFIAPLTLAVLISILGLTGTLECLKPGLEYGGFLGYIFSWPLLKLFGILVAKIIFGVIILIGILIFWNLLKQPLSKEPISETEKRPSLIKKIFTPTFKIKEIEPRIKEMPQKSETPILELQTKEINPQKGLLVSEYKLPPLELLDLKKGEPSAGDIRINSAVIKKTLENFEIPVEMSEVNIGPTVTQYTLKPADGIKLSKITSLSNDLALSLANHPIRIEAPVPGKSLVGIEVPNKVRALVRLRDLIQDSQFQKSSSNLTVCLGKDVSGSPIYTDLARMPHLLVAGATGTGKTIFLNNLILSLLYRNSPDFLRLILVDPKRVEFNIYNELPHLLCPVILDAQKTVNALKWLTEEMERRFDLLAEVKARDILGYNEEALKAGMKNLPYIVLVVDELADLMAARGRDVEAGIVRIAQMARAVGIHLVVATQRPSVEVITGLIKANITSRITFQVASQVDSRTVLDMAGAEKLLGLGDMLFISAEITKPKRIQGCYASDKEVKKVISWIKLKNKPTVEGEEESKIGEEILRNGLSGNLEKTLEETGEEFGGYSNKEDPLFEEAKRIVKEAKKASASLLQRKLRIGYARAARLIDILEEKGIVGPGQGAKPREVYILENNDEYLKEHVQVQAAEGNEEDDKDDKDDKDEGWQKV